MHIIRNDGSHSIFKHIVILSIIKTLLLSLHLAKGRLKEKR